MIRALLQVGEERLGEFERERVAAGRALAGDGHVVGPSEHGVFHGADAEAVAVCEAALDALTQGDPEAAEVLRSEQQRRYGAAAQAPADDEREFIDDIDLRS